MMEAELPDGRVLEFPDGTDPAVIQRTVKNVLGVASTPPAVPAGGGPAPVPAGGAPGPSQPSAPPAPTPAQEITPVGTAASGLATGTDDSLNFILGALGAPGKYARQGMAELMGHLGLMNENEVQGIKDNSEKVGLSQLAAENQNPIARTVDAVGGELVTEQEARDADLGTLYSGARGVGRAAPFAPIAAAAVPAAPLAAGGVELAAGLTSGLGGEATEAMGAPRIVGEIVGSFGPAGIAGLSAGVRTALRGGGKEAQKRAQDAVELFERAGTNATAGQLGPRAQALESVLSRTPSAGGRIGDTAKRQADEIATKAQEVATRAGNGRMISTTDAGDIVKRGIDDFAGRFRSRGGQLFDELDAKIAPDAQVAASTFQRELDDILAGSSPLARQLQSGELRSLREALEQTKDTVTGQVPYSALKEARTLIGERISNPSLLENMNRGQLRKLFGALSEDMKSAATNAGALREWEKANRFWRKGSTKIDDFLGNVAKKADADDVFRAATANTKEGSRRVRQTLSALKPEERKAVASAMINKLGRQTGSGADSLDDTFDVYKFATNYKNMSDDARKALFAGQSVGGLKKDLDDVAEAAIRIRNISRAGGPSGDVRQEVRFAVLSSFFGALGAGQVGAAGMIGGAVATANTSARLMTNPQVVRWLAKASRMPVEQLPGHINRLGAIYDSAPPDQKQAIDNAISQISSRL